MSVTHPIIDILLATVVLVVALPNRLNFLTLVPSPIFKAISLISKAFKSIPSLVLKAISLAIKVFKVGPTNVPFLMDSLPIVNNSQECSYEL